MIRARRGTIELDSGDDLDADYKPPEQETSDSSEEEAPPERGAPDDEDSEYGVHQESDTTPAVVRRMLHQAGDDTFLRLRHLWYRQLR